MAAAHVLQDRHIIVPQQYLSGSIDFLTDMLLDPEGLVARMKAYTHAFNLEAFIKVSAWARLQGRPAG